MASYYYLISSLPALRADAPMPFSYEEFLKMCKNTVSSDVYAKLDELKLSSDDGPLVKQWGTFYNKLMAALCKQRNINLGKQDNSDVEKDLIIDKTVDEALSAKNPLEAEKVLLNCQFEYLDSLTSMHYFNDYVLYGYAIKLRLLERQNVFEQKAGKEEFKRLFDNIQQQILGI